MSEMVWAEDGADRSPAINADGSPADHRRFAGCRQIRRAQTTGVIVGVYHTEECGGDVDSGAWTLICETHGMTIGTSTWRLAKYFAPSPESWCEECQALAFGDNEDRPEGELR